MSVGPAISFDSGRCLKRHLGGAPHIFPLGASQVCVSTGGLAGWRWACRKDLIDMLETKNIVRMRAKIRAKDILG